MRTEALGDVLIEARAGFACGEDPADGVLQFRMNNVTRDGRIDLTKTRRVPPTSRKLEEFLLHDGDVLFNATNSPELVGKTAFVTGLSEPAVFSNHFLRLRPDRGRADGKYLALWLQKRFSERAFETMCRQWVGQATVNREQLLNEQVPIPPLAEQRRIAEILDRAETLRAQRRQALAQLDALAEAIFLDMFGDPVSNSMNWPVAPFESLLADSLRNGVSPSSHGTEALSVLTLSAITGQSFRPEARKVGLFACAPPVSQRVSRGDFLICRGNGNLNLVGRGFLASINMPDTAYPDTIISARLATRRVSPSFLQHVWNGPAVRKQVEALARTTNGTFKVNQTVLEGIRIPLPPLSAQESFARKVNAIEGLRMSQARVAAELDTLFTSLQHRAFRGEL